MDDDRLACVGLASKGYGGGDPDGIEEMPVDTVLELLGFVAFENSYLTTKMALNKPEGGK